MEGFARLAGVQDASQHISDTDKTYISPPPIPQSSTDIEAQTTHSITPRASRAALPANRRPSLKSNRSSRRSIRTASPAPSLPRNTPQLQQYQQQQQERQQQQQQPQTYTASRSSHDSSAIGAAEASDEIPWGPAHPCFPHPNWHVAAASPLHSSTRIIRVPRDWLVAGDAYPALANVYPEVLGDWVDEATFRQVVETLNGMLRRAFTPWGARAWVDAAMGVLTGFLWDDAGLGGAKAGVREIEKWMEGWNREREAEGNEARLIPLRRTGFMNLDIQIPDPEIDMPDPDYGQLESGIARA